MVIVITGPAYSGCVTMANALCSALNGNPVAKLVTAPQKSTVFHKLVTEQEFDEHKFFATHKFSRYRAGIPKFEESANPSVLVVEPELAFAFGRILQDTAYCIYMHCSIRTMLRRRAIESRRFSEDDLSIVHSAYGNHASIYGKLHALSHSRGEGFREVIPVNSDTLEKNNIGNYVSTLLDRLFSAQENDYAS